MIGRARLRLSWMLLPALAGACTPAPAPASRALMLESAVPPSTPAPRPAPPLPRATLLPAVEKAQAEAAFDAAAAKHRVELVDLYHGKGVPRPHMEQATLRTVEKALREAQPAYPPKTGVLFYQHHQGRLHVWMLERGGLRAWASVALAGDALDTQVGALRRSLGVRQMAVQSGASRGDAPTPRPHRPTSETAEVLASTLFPGPVRDALRGLRHVVVVPTMGLGTIPIHMLPVAGAPLGKTRTVSIASSLFDLSRRFPAWQATEGEEALVVGNPTMPALPVGKLIPLEGAEAEADAVAKAWGTAALKGAEATERAVVRRAPRAALLHFATHGVSGSEAALDTSFLALAPSTNADGLLHGREIVGLRLQARLAVLSACQTGLGQVHRAGVIGLARAFQKAGVPRVVMSLWNVDDAPTAEIMTAFATHLKDHPPAEALRRAALPLIERGANPRHWAAFVLLGTPR